MQVTQWAAEPPLPWATQDLQVGVHGGLGNSRRAKLPVAWEGRAQLVPFTTLAWARTG